MPMLIITIGNFSVFTLSLYLNMMFTNTLVKVAMLCLFTSVVGYTK